jgi:hypothetical protein
MKPDITILMGKLDGFLTEVVQRLPLDLFPWASSLSAEDLQAFTVELLQAVYTHNPAQLTELIEDWRATAEALSNPGFMQAWKQRDDFSDAIPWEQVRGELNLSSDPKPGRS